MDSICQAKRDGLVVRLAAGAERDSLCRYVLSHASRFIGLAFRVVAADSPERADFFIVYGSGVARSPASIAGREAVIRIPRAGPFAAALPRMPMALSGPRPTDRVPIPGAFRCASIRARNPLLVFPDRSPAVGLSEGGEMCFAYDLIGMVSALLAGERERKLESDGAGINSLFRQLGEPAETFRAPMVNLNFLLLGRLLKDLKLPIPPGEGEGPSYPEGKRFAVCLTHDVDYLKKTVLQRAKHLRHSAFRASRAVREGRWDEGRSEASALFSRCGGGGDYRRFRHIMALEARYGAVSTFNVYARSGRLTPRRLARDPWYDVRTSRCLQEDLAGVASGGGEIALHGSYDSYRDRELLSRERAVLEEAARLRVAGGRQHFLRFSVPATWLAQEAAGFRYDSTSGFRDLAGFRNGAAFPFRPFDFERGRPIDLWEIPLVLMDGVLFDRDFSGESEVWPRAERALEALRDSRGAGSVCWHQRVFCDRDFPGWGALYERILAWVRDNDGWMGTCRELVEHWEQSPGGQGSGFRG